MNILFISLLDFDSLNESNIYTDLINEFVNDGHFVYVISPMEKRNWREPNCTGNDKYVILKPKIGNISNTPFMEKGLSILGFRKRIIKCIKKNITNIQLAIVAVPPVTVDSVISFVKKEYKAKTYLLLKDIWPDSMSDLNIRPVLLKKAAFCFLRRIEKRLYKVSDSIGCLSEANVNYLLRRNKYLSPSKVHVNPNSIKPTETKQLDYRTINRMKDRYKIPKNKVVFVYGGTLGVGQGVDHITKCLELTKSMNCHYVICGSGVGYDKLKKFCETNMITNVSIFPKMPYERYKEILTISDVGLLFLRYTAKTPNIPSRLLTYMDFSIPVLSCTDPVTDLPNIISGGSFGWSCLSDNPEDYKKTIEDVITLSNEELKIKGHNGKKYLEQFFDVRNSKEIVYKEFCKIGD